MNSVRAIREAAAFELNAEPRLVAILPSDFVHVPDPDGPPRCYVDIGDRIVVFEPAQP